MKTKLYYLLMLLLMLVGGANGTWAKVYVLTNNETGGTLTGTTYVQNGVNYNYTSTFSNGLKITYTRNESGKELSKASGTLHIKYSKEVQYAIAGVPTNEKITSVKFTGYANSSSNTSDLSLNGVAQAKTFPNNSSSAEHTISGLSLIGGFSFGVSAETALTISITTEAITYTSTTINISDLCYGVGLYGKNAENGLDRSVGGFDLTFGGGQGVKYNGDGYLWFGSSGTMTIAPTSANSSLHITAIKMTYYNGNGNYDTSSSNLSAGTGTLTNGTGDDAGKIVWSGSVSSLTLTHTGSANLVISTIEITTDGVPTFSKVTPTISFVSASETILSRTAGTYTPKTTMSPANFAWTWTGTVGSSSGVTYTQGNNNGNAVGDPGTFTTTASATPGTNTMTASYTANENPWFNNGSSSIYTLTVSPNYSGGDNTVQSYPYTWDFNYGSSSWGNTATQLSVFDDWQYNNGNYWNRTNPNDAGYTEPIKYKVDVLKGLELSLDTWIGLDWDYTSGSSHYGHLWMSNGSFIQIPDLSAGQTVTFVMEGREGDVTNETSTTVTLSNATGKDTTIPRSEDGHQTYTYTVTDDGSARFTFNGAISIRSIAVGESTKKSVTFDYVEANGKLLNQIDKPAKGNEVTHIYGGPNSIVRLTAACASDSYKTVEFQKGQKSKDNVKWDNAAFLALSSDRAVIKKVVFTLKSEPSDVSNITVSAGDGTGVANTSAGTYTWTGENSFVKFTANGNNVDHLASIYVEYVERTPLARFNSMGRQTTTFAYQAINPVASHTIIVNPNTTSLSANNSDFEVAFTSNREVIAITAGQAPNIDATNKERVHFNSGVTRGKPGTADVYYRFKGNNTYSGAIAVVTYTINKADHTLSFADNNAAQTQNYSANGTFTHAATLSVGDGAVTYKSSDTNVATVDNSGLVTFVNSGVTTITATAAETEYYNAAKASYTLTVNGANNYSGTITWDTSTGFEIPTEIPYGNDDYVLATTTVEGKTVQYRSSDPTVAKVETLSSHNGKSNVCKITPVSKGTVSIIAYIAGNGDTNPLENSTTSINIGGDNIKSNFYHGSGIVTQGRTLTPYVRVPNILLSDLTDSKITVTTSNAAIATVGAGESTTYGSSVELTEITSSNPHGGILTEGGMIKAIYPTIYGVDASNEPVTITMTFESSKYETTVVTYTVKVVSTDLNFAWAAPANSNNGTVTEYTIYTGDYMMMPAISGNANGNWDYSKGETCETKQAYLYGIRAGDPIWNYTDFKVGGGYPNYRLTESNVELTSEQKNNMTNVTDKAYIIWTSSQNMSDDTLMIYARQAGEVWLHAFDAQTKAELGTHIHITILDKNDLADAVHSYVQEMSYPYTWDFTKDFNLTATPNYWEPHYNSNSQLDYYICGYSTMFNWDYCDQDNNGSMNEALGNVEAKSPYNKYFVASNTDAGMTNVMPQFYGMSIYSGNSGDTRTKSYESKRDKLRIKPSAGEGNPHIQVVGGIHYLRLPSPKDANILPADQTFKLIVKARPTSGKTNSTMYKYKDGNHSHNWNSSECTAVYVPFNDLSFVTFDISKEEITGDHYIELGIDNVDIYWIAMTTEAKTINPASGATGNSIEMMATYSYDKAIDYAKSSEANGIDAYVATNVDVPNTTNPAITVTMNKADISVPTQTGMLLRATTPASSYKWTFANFNNNCYSNGKNNNVPVGETEGVFSYSLSQNVDGLQLEANGNGMAKIEECNVTVGDNTYFERLNLLGKGEDGSDPTKTLGRRYVTFNLTGPTTIAIDCEPEDVTKGNKLRVACGTSNVNLTETLATFTLTSGAKTYTCDYTGTGATIFIFGTEGTTGTTDDEKKGLNGYGIRLYSITKTTKGLTAYMVADAENKSGYETPSNPTTNLLKGTGSNSRVIYQVAKDELCTEEGDAYVPFLFSSKYMHTSTGNQVHNAGYFSFWRVWTSSTTQGAQKAYLVLPTGTYENALNAWGKAADISGNLKQEAASRGMLLRFVDEDQVEDDLTDISVIEADGVQEVRQKGNDKYYDLRGIGLEHPAKPGLYIHNGKKIWVK